MAALVATASIETSAPLSPSSSARRSIRAGMAVVSLALSGTASWPSTRRAVVAKAETRCSGGVPVARSWLRREVLPSMATNSGRSGQDARTQAVKAAANRPGLMRFINGVNQRPPGTPWYRADSDAAPPGALCPIRQSDRSPRSRRSSRTPRATAPPAGDGPPATARADPRFARNDPEALSGATSASSQEGQRSWQTAPNHRCHEVIPKRDRKPPLTRVRSPAVSPTKWLLRRFDHAATYLLIRVPAD